MLNPSNAEAAILQSTKMQKSSKPYHVAIHWVALNEYSQMSTHKSGLQSFFRFLHQFVLAKLATSSIRVKRGEQSHIFHLINDQIYIY